MVLHWDCLFRVHFLHQTVNKWLSKRDCVLILFVSQYLTQSPTQQKLKQMLVEWMNEMRKCQLNPYSLPSFLRPNVSEGLWGQGGTFWPLSGTGGESPLTPSQVGTLEAPPVSSPAPPPPPACLCGCLYLSTGFSPAEQICGDSFGDRRAPRVSTWLSRWAW